MCLSENLSRYGSMDTATIIGTANTAVHIVSQIPIIKISTALSPFLVVFVAFFLSSLCFKKKATKLLLVSCYAYGYDITLHRKYLAESKTNPVCLTYFKDVSLDHLDALLPPVLHTNNRRKHRWLHVYTELY